MFSNHLIYKRISKLVSQKENMEKVIITLWKENEKRIEKNHLKNKRK